MNNQIPRVSIGLPVYNGERFIQETLDSLLAQTYTNFELIISNNASTDDTEAICRAYAARDQRIRYYRNKTNLGAAFNYNRVFELSGGEYFKWTAANDVCGEEFLSRCVEGLDTNPEVVLCYPKTTIIDEQGKIVMMDEDEIHLDSPNIVIRFSSAVWRPKFFHNPVMGLIRRCVLLKTRLIGHYLATDRCLVAELTLYGLFKEIPERLFFRRKHHGNIGIRREGLEFLDPLLKGNIVLPEWRVCREHFISIKRAPLRFTVKMRLVKAVLRRAIYTRRSFRYELTEAIEEILSRWWKRMGFRI